MQKKAIKFFALLFLIYFCSIKLVEFKDDAGFTSSLGSNSYKVSSNNNLSPREIEVLKGLVGGLDYKEIAEQLFVSPNTVRNQISSIYQKLHVTCKVDAVKIALKSGFIQ